MDYLTVHLIEEFEDICRTAGGNVALPAWATADDIADHPLPSGCVKHSAFGANVDHASTSLYPATMHEDEVRSNGASDSSR